MTEQYLAFIEPKRGLPDDRVVCSHCSSELEATGETFTGISMSGIRWFTWRHVKTGKPTCEVTYDAEPYDDWVATRRIEQAERATDVKAGK